MTGQQIREKSSARKVLAVLVGLLATLLALETLATVRSGGAFEVFAQQTGTAPTIKLINPDSTTSTEISDKNDTEDTTYHLVAWISNAPANPVVQFEYQPEGGPEIPITCADTGTVNARAATADTYECDWNVNVEDGAGVVRAELYSGTGKVAEDEEAVEVDSTGQTVEIVYPRQGEAVGFYTGPDGISTAMIDVKTSAAGTPEGDEGTQRVTVYYSVSQPGAEPVFEPCGTEDVTGGAQESIRCDMLEDDTETPERENDPSRITAIAATAGDTTEGSAPGPGCTQPIPGVCDADDTDAADAHRAFGYQQDPSAVNVNPQTQEATPGQCSGLITATVTDQNGRAIVGVNIDVHAQGPTDALYFDDNDASNNQSSASKAPENHAEEQAVNCEDTEPPPGFAGAQGRHERVDADIKHIESANDAGTDEQGKYTFKLYSPSTGATQFTVWADEDGDDNRCSGEATGIGSIGWGQAAPSPTGVQEETQPCPTPTGTGSPTGSPTATPTQTQTGSPTGSPTTTQAPAECQDGADNDGDGDTDMNDEDCDFPEDDDESPDDTGNEVQSGPCAGFQEGSRNPRPNGGLVIVGTQGPDDLRGSGRGDIICGLGGRDSIRGAGGNDRIYGAGGHDDLRGNAGNDLISGQGGLDVIRGGGGADVAKGGARNDTIRGYDGRDRLVGGGGDDTLRAGDGRDSLYGNKGRDLLDGGRGSDLCRPGPGRDSKIRCER